MTSLINLFSYIGQFVNDQCYQSTANDTGTSTSDHTSDHIPVDADGWQQCNALLTDSVEANTTTLSDEAVDCSAFTATPNVAAATGDVLYDKLTSITTMLQHKTYDHNKSAKTYTFPNGDTYTGVFTDTPSRYSYGEYRTAVVETEYRGQWKSNPQGTAQLFEWGDGEYLQWRGFVMHDQGVLMLRNGTLLCGEFVNGVLPLSGLPSTIKATVSSTGTTTVLGRVRLKRIRSEEVEEGEEVDTTHSSGDLSGAEDDDAVRV